jgi:hypothetical protein
MQTAKVMNEVDLIAGLALGLFRGCENGELDDVAMDLNASQMQDVLLEEVCEGLDIPRGSRESAKMLLNDLLAARELAAFHLEDQIALPVMAGIGAAHRTALRARPVN